MQDERQRQKQPAKPISIGSEIGSDGELTDEQFAAVKKYVEQLGGIENARRAVAALKELAKAA